MTTVKTNPAVLAGIYDMMRDDPEGFKKMRLQPLTTQVSGSDIEQIARVQREMSKPDREKAVATTAQLLSTYVGGWKAEKKAQFQGAAYDELNAFEKEKGHPASYDEQKQIFDRLILNGEVMSGSWWKPNPDKQFFEATPEERARFAPEIRSEERAAIIQRFKARGIANPSDAQVTEAFKAWKGLK